MTSSFECDEQTIHDLEIFKEKGQPSIFNLFNKTFSAGGRCYLKLLMEHPLDDLKELEKRQDLIQYFIERPPVLKTFSRHVNFIEKYIHLNYSVLKANPLDANLLRLTEWFNPTNEYYLVRSGCESIIHILHELHAQLDYGSLPEGLEAFTSLQQLLYAEVFKQVDPQAKLSWKQLIRLDRLFRKQHKDKLAGFLQEIYLLDAYLSIAKTAKEEGFCLAHYVSTEQPIYKADGLWHPLLEAPISNNMELDQEENMCFLTGPNMAGKSTFLKSVGLAVYLAHLGFPIPAKTFHTSVYSTMITTINLTDNMGAGYSHFYSEVRRVKQAAQALATGKRVFVIFDELFRGTNVKDAFEASAEIIKAFAQVENCTFFVSTHILEVADELQENERVSFKCFHSDLIEGKLKYTYQLQEGVSSERIGKFIVEKEGILELLDTIKKPFV